MKREKVKEIKEEMTNEIEKTTKKEKKVKEIKEEKTLKEKSKGN